MQPSIYPGLWKKPACIVLLALLSSSLPAQTNPPVRKYSSVERMQTAHLQAAHADAVRLQQQRHTLPPLPGLHDYKAILHAHAEDSSHTGGTRPEMHAERRQRAPERKQFHGWPPRPWCAVDYFLRCVQ